jgi:hypothetical protein
MKKEIGYVIMRYKPRVPDGCFTEEMKDGDGKRCYGRVEHRWDWPKPSIYETLELSSLQLEWLKENRLKFMSIWEVTYDKKKKTIIEWIKKIP